MNLPLTALGALLGAAWGWFVCARLRNRAYRYPDEADWARRDHRPVVVPLTALLGALVLGRAAALGTPFWVVALAAVAVAAPLIGIDYDVRRLPDRIVLPSYPVLAAALLGCAAWTGRWSALGRAGLAAAVLFVAFFAVCLVGGGTGLGFGDVKLMGLLGALLGWVGWATVLAGVMLGFLLGGLVAMALLASGRATRKTPVPMGPMLIAGALAAVCLA